MPTCAYCKAESKMTREHVIPSFLYEFQYGVSKSILGWNEVAGKFLPSESIVKDVCPTCNNVKLADLDDKGKTLLTSAGVMVKNYIKRSITLHYAFDDLVRWLLKISFNSSRADGVHAYMFEPHIPYMLDGKSRIKRSQLAILGFMAAPLNLAHSEEYRSRFSLAADGASTLNPFLVRVSYGMAVGREAYQLRMVSFGALYFIIMVFNEGILPGHAAAEIRSLIKANPGTVEVTPNSKILHLTAGHRTWLDLYSHQVNRVIDVMRGTSSP